MEDQYMQGGAPNFETALSTAAVFFQNLSEEVQEEVLLFVVGRYNEVTIIGQGEQLPSNEEGPTSGGFIVFRDDVINFLEDDGEDEEDDDDDGEEDEDAEDDDEGSEEEEVAKKSGPQLL